MRLIYLLLLSAVIVIPADGQIVINEFNAGSPDFVELRNLGFAVVNIGGYVVESYQSNGGTPSFEGSYTLPAGTMLGPRDEFVLEENGSAGTPASGFPCGVHTGYNYNWTASRNIILILRDASNTPLDYVYRNNNGGAGGAPSLPSGLSWTGSFNTSGNACSRLSDTDSDTASDWTTNSSASPCVDNPGQSGLPPVLLTLTSAGGGQLSVSTMTVPALPGALFWNLVSFQDFNPDGSGPLFGIGLDALPQIAGPTGTIFHDYLDASGQWSFNGPAGTVPPGLFVEVVTVAVDAATNAVVWSNVKSITF